MSLDVYLENSEGTVLYTANITHNLNTMAEKAGIYLPLWRPEEIGITTARQLVPLLSAGFNKLMVGKEIYERYNPKNGWGDYEGLYSFVLNYLCACAEHSEAFVSVSR